MDLKKYNTNFYELLQLTIQMEDYQKDELLKYARIITDKRKKERNPCLIYATYEIEKHTENGFIIDINYQGAYVVTNSYYEVGNTIILKFNNPYTCRNLCFFGKILWSIDFGIGIKFINFFPSKREFRCFVKKLFANKCLKINYSSFFENIIYKSIQYLNN
jgi:hypothetical protein